MKFGSVTFVFWSPMMPVSLVAVGVSSKVVTTGACRRWNAQVLDEIAG